MAALSRKTPAMARGFLVPAGHRRLSLKTLAADFARQ
jgi:hypothetical protein